MIERSEKIFQSFVWFFEEKKLNVFLEVNSDLTVRAKIGQRFFTYF
jgi:hypothetical protein